MVFRLLVDRKTPFGTGRGGYPMYVTASRLNVIMALIGQEGGPTTNRVKCVIMPQAHPLLVMASAGFASD